MLILSRMQDESIIIGEDIIVTIVGIKDGKVKIGIDAPQHVCVDREEVRERRIRNGEHNAR